MKGKLERKGAGAKPAGDISILVVKPCCLVLPESLSAPALFFIILLFALVSLMNSTVAFLEVGTSAWKSGPPVGLDG